MRSVLFTLGSALVARRSERRLALSGSLARRSGCDQAAWSCTERAMANDFLLHRFTSRHADTSGSAFGVHPDGGMAALGSTEGIRVIDLNWPWEVNRVLQQPNTGGCAVLQWHPQPNRRAIAAAGRHGSLGLYDLDAQSSAQALVASLNNIDQVAVDALGWRPSAANEVAIRMRDGTVALWDVRSTSLQPISSLTLTLPPALTLILTRTRTPTPTRT